MKSFTDIEQSKNLAKILPIESADMYYWCGTQIRIGGHRAMDKDLDVPCWSLAALLNVLPDTITSNDGIAFSLYVKKNTIEYSNYSLYLTYKSVKSKNPIDACYKLILRLHELKMLRL